MKFVPNTLILVTCLQILGCSPGKSQKICQFVTSQNITTSKTKSVFINNFSTNKCLRIGNFGHYASKVLLDDCFWGTATITKDENLYLRNNSLVSNGITIFNYAGRGEEYCLSSSTDGFAMTSICRQTSFDQVWKIKGVRDHNNQFQIQQSSSTLCLVPKTRETRSLITLVSCNAYQTEQLWKICATA